MYAAAASECFSFVLAMKMSQKTDHHSKRNPPGASIAIKVGIRRSKHTFQSRKKNKHVESYGKWLMVDKKIYW